MKIQVIQTSPFQDQSLGTSGLRRKVSTFKQPNYLENFIQSVFDVMQKEQGLDCSAGALVLGGDGRYYNNRAIQIILRVAIANGFGRIVVGRQGIFSTPAVSATIRRRKASGGIILSASHNPGGPRNDFGIKYNVANGGPSPSSISDKIYARTKSIQEYKIVEMDEVPLDVEATIEFSHTKIEIIDPMRDYNHLMQELFHFDQIRELFRSGFQMSFDAMNAVTGPYACELFENLLGAGKGTVMRAVPLEDFGGEHPDPNLVYAKELVRQMSREDAVDFGAASDGDGDRNMILGKNFFVSPGDSLAVIVEHLARVAPGYRAGLLGVARSMPTSRAVDRVAKEKGFNCYETPTGWKYFGNLMDADLCTVCGEESFGTGSSHIREKDGLWAVLCWLAILADTKKTVRELVEDLWSKYGRFYFQRYDYENLNLEKANQMMAAFSDKIATLKNQKLGTLTVLEADCFSYQDPVDGSVAENQGYRVFFDNESRVVFRLSGTGTQGATLRIYVEKYVRRAWQREAGEVLSPLFQQALDLLRVREFCGVETPTVVT